MNGLGGRVLRAALVRDDPGPLAEEVRAALARGPAALFTCGGLGPTADDGTLAAVARAAGVPLEEDPRALAMVRASYESLAAKGWVASAALTPERRKMALLPRGARPIPNPVGAAPAAVLPAGRTTAIALPGVPEELRAILDGPLRPELRALFGAGAYVEEEAVARCGDESVLAPLAAAAAAAFPGVRVKTRARGFGPDVRIRITLAARGDDEAAVRALLAGARAAFAAACRREGIALGTSSPDP